MTAACEGRGWAGESVLLSRASPSSSPQVVWEDAGLPEEEGRCFYGPCGSSSARSVTPKSNSTAFPRARFDTLIIFAALTATILNATLKSSKCSWSSLHASGTLAGLESPLAVTSGLGGFLTPQ